MISTVINLVILSAPLALVLLSIAFMPLINNKFWHKYESYVLFFLSVISVVSTITLREDHYNILYHTIVKDYTPFIIMLFTLYTLSHGIHIKISAKATPINNIIFLGIGSILASFIGTTGASILLLQPFLALNKKREHKAHLVVFFIFLIANIGGLLSPLGDPPLLLGFIHGVKFFWCFQNLFGPWLMYVSSCLAILYVVDSFIMKKETDIITAKTKLKLEVKGMFHIFLVLATVVILFFDFKYSSLVLPLISAVSILKSSKEKKIDFHLFKEVAVTFLAIFIVMAPVAFILTEHSTQIKMIMGTDAKIYFWICGAFSFFLDNAPSYLLFFDIAGGNAADLMLHPVILKAISLGAVVMGAMTYIGNAPNLMVRSFALKAGVKMPSFVMYIAWAALVILPISLVMTLFL